MLSKQKVLLGMSGGVDSSVSAILLLEAGYEVIGAFMKNWSGDVCGPRTTDESNVGEAFAECGWKQERRDAARVAAQLGIAFVTFDFEMEYRRDVVENMFAEFEAGRTPNPDVMCNKYIKFNRFVKEADRLGCTYVATGHYAQVKGRGNRGEGLGIFKANDSNKDQTYFLWAIDKTLLSRVLFPIGHLTKPEVRAKAREFGLVVADKKDSMGICFVGDVEIREFLGARMKDDPGDIVTVDGKIVGRHRGINFFTIGQRHGLNVGGGEPYYVVEKRPDSKRLVVSSNFHPALFCQELRVRNLNVFVEFNVPLRCEARIRHRQPVQWCQIVSHENDYVQVAFDEPQRAVTPGQSIVFYVGEEMIGGGIIEE